MGSTERAVFTQEGSVLKIKMKNFMTYKDETIHPGPNFNVTVGPNGSGKSSVVTALSICLGGDLKSLNRQADLQSLINNDCGNEAATIEVELFSKKGTLVVKTVITKDSVEPKWTINKKPATKEKLMNLTERLQIQPGNLCQFLPQDVVREFPQMRPPQIFENTIKAVGDEEMLNKLHKGGEIQGKIEEIGNILKTKRNTVVSNEQKEKKLEGDMKILEQVEELEERKSVIEKALSWERFRNLRSVVRETRDQKRSLEEKKIKLQKELDPIQEFLQKYNENVQAVKAEGETVEKELRMKGSQVEGFDIYQLEDELDMQATREKDLTRDEKDRLQKQKNTKEEIAELQKFIAANPLDTKLEENLRNLKAEKIRREDQLSQREHVKQETESSITLCKREIGKLEQSKKELLNTNNRKMAVLEKENPDTYQGVRWLREHRDRFKSPVHEPIMLCLEVVDNEYAKYLETHVGRADLEGFICEDADDVNLLLKELREGQRLRKINAFHSYPKSRNLFRSPYANRELEKYGFKSYLSDMYKAPDAVNAYLCQQKNLHQVPLFREENEYTDELKTKFCSYYISNLKFTTKKSKYSQELSTGTEDIGSRRVIRLANNLDNSKLKEVETELEEKLKSKRNHEGRLKTQLDTIEKLKEAVRDVTEKTKKLEAVKKEFKSKQTELVYKEEFLKSLQKPQCNLEQEKVKIKQKKCELVAKLCKEVQGVMELTKACSKLDLQRRCKLLQLHNVESENQEMSDRGKELEKELSVTNEELDKFTKKFETEKKILQKSHSEAEKATDGVMDEKQKHRPPEVWQRKFSALGTTDENMLQVMKDDCINDIKKKKVSPGTIQKIKEIKETLEVARAEVVELEKSLKEHTSELESLRKGWIHGVRRLVNQVGDKFSEMMARLGYAGQLELCEGLNGDLLDLKNYGIRILVKFRSGDDFDELTKGTQSGGEKSVTTAVYMMALQGITQVPFRCVDEINQGMDETNERRVWDMLLEVCRDHQAQYFYMAPKFPYNLPFDDQVTILVCNSGCTKKKHSDGFSTASFIEKSRRL